MKEIKRDLYLNRLIDRRENGSIKVITGIRRCGKSYLLFHLYKDYLLSDGVDENCIVEIPLDDDDFEEYRNKKRLSQYIKEKTIGQKTYYVFLDEVQFCEGFENVLNGLARKENLDIYVTGSNSKFLSSDILTEFRGRGDEVRVYPLSFSEYVSAFGGDKNDAWREYMMYGGLPRILSCKTDEQKSKYLSDLFQNVYIKDVIERNHLRDYNILDDVVNVLASCVGSLTNVSKLTNTFISNGIKTNDKTIASYIGHLTDAFLIEKVNRYNIKGRKYIGSSQKYYYTDVGLRNARLNFRQHEPTHIMENIIYNELVIRGYNVDVGVVEKYYKNEDGKQKTAQLEIDFVCNIGSNRYYIQSAYSLPDDEKFKQETASLDRIDDSFKKVIIVADNVKPWHSDKGYLIINILDFLMNQNSLEQ